MSFDADVLVDRRRTRRKLSFWRVVAFLLLAAALGLGILLAGGDEIAGAQRPHIARISVTGVILEDREVSRMLERIAETDAVKGVVVAIDSPGGSTTGGEALYVGLREIAAAKPTVSTVGTLAASAGYMTAIATDHIVAKRTSITGSIGVYFQYGNVARLLESLGVEVSAVKSAPLKAEPSPFSAEEVPGARAMIAALVDDTYQWFVDIVAERRGFDRATALRLADGSIYSGRQALEAGLIDAIGDEADAIAWLEAERGVPADLPVLDWKPAGSDDGFLFGASLVDLAGSVIGIDLRSMVERPALDGLVSVWHPKLTELQ